MKRILGVLILVLATQSSAWATWSIIAVVANGVCLRDERVADVIILQSSELEFFFTKDFLKLLTLQFKNLFTQMIHHHK